MHHNSLIEKDPFSALKKPVEAMGFTLLEVLLALAVGAILLTAASSYVVSLANLWLNSGDDDFFMQHVDGVTLFLNSSLSQAESLGEQAADPVFWDRPPGYSEFDDPLLTFRLKDSPPILVWEGDPLPGITGHLHFEHDEGLSLFWYSRLLEIEDENDVRRTDISPLVTAVSYCYYDPESDNWDFFDDPEEDRSGQFILPDFIKLRFEHEDEVREVPIYIPRTSDRPKYADLLTSRLSTLT